MQFNILVKIRLQIINCRNFLFSITTTLVLPDRFGFLRTYITAKIANFSLRHPKWCRNFCKMQIINKMKNCKKKVSKSGIVSLLQI